MQKLNIWYMSNAGIILETEDINIGFDIFTGENISPYMGLMENHRNLLMEGCFFPIVELLTVTHEHHDHFSCKKTGDYLRRHEHTLFWGTKKTQEELIKEEFISPGRFLSETSQGKNPLWEHANVRIRRIRSSHMGNEALKTEHDSLLVETDQKHLLITGDARPGESFYRRLRQYTQKIDVLICPFPFLGLKSARKCLAESFSPDQIFLVHLPSPELDPGNWISSTVKICQEARDGLARPVYCQTAGKCYRLGS